MNEVLLVLFSLIVGLLLGTSILAAFSIEFRDKIGVRLSVARTSALVLFLLMLVALWLETPTRLGEYVYIERDIPNRKEVIHTNSSCVKIKKGYEVTEAKFYKYTPYFDEFCKKCMYESDVIKLTKGK